MENVTQIAQLTINGMSIGAIYGLVALGLVLTYKSTEVLNFAHGDVLMFSAFLGWGLIEGLGASFWLALPAAAIVAAAATWLLEQRVVRIIAGQPQFAGVMLTIGLAFMIRGMVSMGFGPESRNFTTPWAGQISHVGGIVIADLNLIIIAVTLVITAGLYGFLTRSAVGVAIQAASQNQLAAYLSGIRVKRLNSLVWGISGAIAAVSGMLLAPITMVDIGLWAVLLKGLAALVLGGFGSVRGAIVGGLLIGLIEQFSGVFLPDGFKDVMAYLVLIGVLIVWPRGLFSEAHGRRV